MEITIYRRHWRAASTRMTAITPGVDAHSGFSSTGRGRRTRRWTGTNFIVGRTRGLPRPASGRKRRPMSSGLRLTLRPCWKVNQFA